MKETRAERKARKQAIREARRHAKEAKLVTPVPQTGSEATTYAMPADTPGESGPAPSPGGNPVVVTHVVREWHQHAPESLGEIHQAIDAWGGINRLDPEKLAQRVDKVTRHVGDREVVVKETVTEWVRPEADEADDAPAAPRAERHAEPRKAGKRKPRILGFFGSRRTKEAVDEAVEARRSDAQPGDADYQPQCKALTADGAQCRNSARGESKYCASHKGYQPPTAKGIAKRVEGEAWDPKDKVTDAMTVRAANTRPKVRKAKDTRLSQRKSRR